MAVLLVRLGPAAREARQLGQFGSLRDILDHVRVVVDASIGWIDSIRSEWGPAVASASGRLCNDVSVGVAVFVGAAPVAGHSGLAAVGR